MSMLITFFMIMQMYKVRCMCRSSFRTDASGFTASSLNLTMWSHSVVCCVFCMVCGVWCYCVLCVVCRVSGVVRVVRVVCVVCCVLCV